MTQARSPSASGRSKCLVIRVGVLCAASSAMAGLTGCGQDAQGPIVVRVGETAIRRAEVDHWASAIAQGATPVNALGFSTGGSNRQAALRFLIASKWLTSQAAAEGAVVSERAVERTLVERTGAGGDELKQRLKSAGQTIADGKLEIQAELAAEAIGHILTRRAAQITPRETAAFYRHNRARFRLGEQRETELIEGLPSRAVAFALVKRIGAGPRFTEHVTNYETLLLEPPPNSERAAVLHAIFTAPRGVATLMRLDKHWAAFVVRRIVPARLLSFAQARADVIAALVAKRHRLLTAAYLESYRREWTARTSCSAGYIAQGCRQYAGPRRPEANPFANADP